jgi:hypothetical protein
MCDSAHTASGIARIGLGECKSSRLHLDLEPLGPCICRGPAKFDSIAFRDCAGPLSHVNSKGTAMKLPIETIPAFWGVVGGAVALAIVGFTWGGWVTGAKAEAQAMQRADAAVVAALAPICVEKFRSTADVSDNLAELKKIDSWSRGDFVEKGGWATVPGPGSPEQVSAVAKACALVLSGA